MAAAFEAALLGPVSAMFNCVAVTTIDHVAAETVAWSRIRKISAEGDVPPIAAEPSRTTWSVLGPLPKTDLVVGEQRIDAYDANGQGQAKARSPGRTPMT